MEVKSLAIRDWFLSSTVRAAPTSSDRVCTRWRTLPAGGLGVGLEPDADTVVCLKYCTSILGCRLQNWKAPPRKETYILEIVEFVLWIRNFQPVGFCL